jgi:N6-adenosine-specific RNA methylase IME4
MIPGEKSKTKVKRIELFARESREGWDVWGNEVSLGECHAEAELER